MVMIGQRPRGAAPVIQGTADALPFADAAFDASLAVLTVHHWPELGGGLDELTRVARDRVVVFTHDPEAKGFWLNEYFPEIEGIDSGRLPTLSDLTALMGGARVVGVPVPHDCVDGFLGAYWRRPERYLEADVRAGISCFAQMNHLDEGLVALAHDLESGEWGRRNRDLLDRDSVDLGYRLVIAEKGAL